MNGNRMPVARLWLMVATILTFAALCPQQAQAQVPARFYLKPLAGVSAIPLIYESISGNSNPFDPSHSLVPKAAGADSVEVDATMALPGYALTFPLFERSAMAAILVPMGHISGEATLEGSTVFKESASGYGDPMLEFTFNLIGPPAQMNIPDSLAYEPGFSLDLLVDLVVPIGEYDNDQQINIGQNRWIGRLGTPIIYQIGPWVPGRRTTLELLPVVWLFGDNDDFVGQTMETDPLFQVDAHLTRDFTQTAWGSLDLSWYNGGKATIAGIEGDKRNDIMAGITLGYQVNDNLGLTFGYKSTLNDDAPDDFSQDLFMVTLTYGWHPMVEGMKRLKGE